RNGSESAQDSHSPISDDDAIHLQHTKGRRENASIMAERTIFPLPTAVEQVLIDRKRGRSEEFKPQRLRKYVASHPRSLKIACVIHTSRDAQTAVYKNTNERVQYLQGLGHHCTIITPEDFPLLRQVDGRFIPLVYPILVARWLARHSDIDVALF